MKDKIWLSPPHMGPNEAKIVQDVFASNWIAPLGPEVNGFEKDLQQFNGIEHAVALSSGTGAIHIALDLLGIGRGDIVLIQSFTFCGSANPVAYRSAEAIFIDSEPDTWNMDPEALESALSDLKAKGELEKVKAILPVHLYGMPAKIDKILEIASRYGIAVIEDAAESLGSKYEGRMTGTFGNFGIYSFNGNKIITTSGGGALVSPKGEWIDRARFLATQARDDAPHYQHSVIGYNYRLSNVLAGIGRGQMQVLPERIATRRKTYNRYRKYFESWNAKGFNFKFQEENEKSESNRWLTCILVDPDTNKGLTREDIRLALEAENIESRPLWKPMHLQPVFKANRYYGHDVAERLFDIGLCLPSGTAMTEEDFNRIFTVFDSLLEQRG